MDKDKLEFLEERAEEVTQDEPDTVEVAEEPKEPKGEKPAEPIEAEAPVEEAPSAPPAPEPEPQRIPLTAMLDEREKRQKAERELEEMRRYIAAQQQKDKKPVPDFYEQPDERLAYERQRWEAEMHNRFISQSRFMAEKDFGKELVEEAFGFFDQPQNRFMTHQFRDHPSPFHAAVEFYKKQKFLNEVNDPDAWRNAERERIRQELMAEISQPSKPKAPPPSMAKAAAVGGTETIAPGNTFDGLFPS